MVAGPDAPHRLVAEAVEGFAAEAAEVPDSGRVEEDLRRWARSIVAMLTARDSGAVVRALFSTGETAAIRDLRRRFYRTRSALVVPIVERAVERGELPGDRRRAGRGKGRRVRPLEQRA